jgi:Protein of unknown function (DUF3341)
MSDLYGVLASFKTPDAAANAAAQLRQAGIESLDAYTPYPVEALNRIVRPGRNVLLPATMFAGAVFGAAYGYWIQYWDEALDYPINVGGRPHNSWPAFVVSTFEFMLLVAVAAGLVAMLAASRLPKLYHPTFAAKAFERASRDRFVICVKASDPRFDPASLRDTFGKLGAEEIEEVRA